MKKNGFTLIEAILTVLVTSIGIAGVMHLFQGTVSSAFDTDRSIQAAELGRERLERITFDKRMFGYDYVTAANYPAVENFAGAYLPFTRTLQIQEVRSDDLNQPGMNTGYKRVTVAVGWGANAQAVTLEALLTRWNE